MDQPHLDAPTDQVVQNLQQRDGYRSLLDIEVLDVGRSDPQVVPDAADALYHFGIVHFVLDITDHIGFFTNIRFFRRPTDPSPQRLSGTASIRRLRKAPAMRCESPEPYMNNMSESNRRKRPPAVHRSAHALFRRAASPAETTAGRRRKPLCKQIRLLLLRSILNLCS